MSEAHPAGWNDEEVVSLNNLRPARKYFGPLPDADAKPQKKGRKPAQGQQRRPAPEQGRRPERRPDHQERPAQRPVQRPVRPAQAQARPAQEQARRPQQRPAQRPQEIDLRDRRPAPQPTKSVQAPVEDGSIVVFSRKGGVGKTTITAHLAMTLAAQRGGRILAIDGDAESGSLGWLMAPQAPATLAALSTAQPIPNSYRELREYTAACSGGVDLIVGDTDGRQAVNQAGLEDALVNIARNYDLSVYDTGGGASISASRVLVKHAKVMLLVMGPSVDSIRAAERTLAWIDERPGQAADPNVRIIAVINGVPNTVKEAHIKRIEEHFASRCDAVVRVPWDSHLSQGMADVSLEKLDKGTRKAFGELASTTINLLNSPRRKKSRPQGARRVS